MSGTNNCYMGRTFDRLHFFPCDFYDSFLGQSRGVVFIIPLGDTDDRGTKQGRFANLRVKVIS